MPYDLNKMTLSRRQMNFKTVFGSRLLSIYTTFASFKVFKQAPTIKHFSSVHYNKLLYSYCCTEIILTTSSTDTKLVGTCGDTKVGFISKFQPISIQINTVVCSLCFIAKAHVLSKGKLFDLQSTFLILEADCQTRWPPRDSLLQCLELT